MATEKNNDKKKFRIRHLPSLLKQSAISLKKEDPWRMSAVISFYVILSLPGLLVVILNFIGAVWGEDLVEGGLAERISEIIGEEAADAVQVIIESSQEEQRGFVSTMFGIGTFIFGATGAFYAIQVSLNRIWEVRPKPGSGIKRFILDRIMNFGFVLLIWLLIFVSFLTTTLLSVLNEYIEELVPDFSLVLAYSLNEFLAFSIITVLFAMMYRFLPDARIRWKTVWVGAIITSLLFVAGKLLMGLYFGRIDPASAFGVAGSIVLILLWVTYSALIFFLGAEFTCIYAKQYGIGIRPKPNAVRIVIKEEIIEYGSKAYEND